MARREPSRTGFFARRTLDTLNSAKAQRPHIKICYLGGIVKHFCEAFIAIGLFASTLAAQSPAFTGIVNPASNIPPGLPNSGVAQGSIFVVYGSNLGPASLVQAAALPLPTTAGLAGTSITIAQGGGTPITAPMLYTSAGQVAAVLPSNAPIGNDTLTLTYNGKSASFPVFVVQSNFGISTVAQSGSGAAVVTFANNSLVTATNSAKPGDSLVVWGTGLGPITGSDAVGATGGNLPAQIQVFVGGVQATVQYQGRTPTAVGLDQINITVPQNAPTGCWVPIVVQTNNAGGTPITVSNTPSIAIAPNGGACNDPLDIVPQSAVPSLLTKSTINTLIVQLETNSPFAGFLGFTSSQAQALLSGAHQDDIANASLNTCTLKIFRGTPTSGFPSVFNGLDAGKSVTFTPPAGSPAIFPLVIPGGYAGSLAAVPSGTWQLTTPGGADVGPMTIKFPVPQSVIWNNQSQIAKATPIDRTKPLTINWTGGDVNGYVIIKGNSTLGPQNNPTYSINFGCVVPATAGTFTIPPAILMGMPTGGNAFPGISVTTWAYPATLGPVPGFDVTAHETDLEQPALGVTFK
jgi:uncharacterized protein (TIGR03437 family)